MWTVEKDPGSLSFASVLILVGLLLVVFVFQGGVALTLDTRGFSQMRRGFGVLEEEQEGAVLCQLSQFEYVDVGHEQ